MTRQTRCVDCLAAGSVSARAAPKPGPRCLEHWRAEKRRRATAKHARYIEATYELSQADYDAIIEAQGGGCPCGMAKGVAKRLAVDHDHHFHDGEDPPPHPRDVGCRLCIRGCLCATCNRVVVGRYSVAALERLIAYKTNPPARAVLSP